LAADLLEKLFSEPTWFGMFWYCRRLEVRNALFPAFSHFAFSYIYAELFLLRRIMEKHRIDQKKMDKTLDDILRYLKSVIRIEDKNYIQFLSPVDVFFNCYGKD